MAGAHFEEDVLAREVGQVGVVLVDQLEQRLILLSRLDLFRHWAAFENRLKYVRHSVADLGRCERYYCWKSPASRRATWP